MVAIVSSQCVCFGVTTWKEERRISDISSNGMSLKVTGVYFSASSAGPGPGKMKATIRAARHHPPPPMTTTTTSLSSQPIHYVHHHQQQQLPSAVGRNHSPANNELPLSSQQTGQSTKGRIISHHSHLHSQSLDYLHLNFEEKRQIIASSLSLVDFLHHPPVKVKGTRRRRRRGRRKRGGNTRIHATLSRPRGPDESS